MGHEWFFVNLNLDHLTIFDEAVRRPKIAVTPAAAVTNCKSVSVRLALIASSRGTPKKAASEAAILTIDAQIVLASHQAVENCGPRKLSGSCAE